MNIYVFNGAWFYTIFIGKIGISWRHKNAEVNFGRKLNVWIDRCGSWF